MNLYAYVLGRPLALHDPLGLCASFSSRFFKNFKEANAAIPGLLAPIGLGLLTGAKTAAHLEVPSLATYLSQAIRLRGLPSLAVAGIEVGRGATLAATGTSVLANFVFVGAAYELGLGIGSAINSISVGPCCETVGDRLTNFFGGLLE